LSQFKINVNAIQPGWIETPGKYKAFSREIIEKEASNLPWGRLGLSKEIVQVACFLISEQAEYITESILTVDDGFRYKDLRTNIQNKH